MSSFFSVRECDILSGRRHSWCMVCRGWRHRIGPARACIVSHVDLFRLVESGGNGGAPARHPKGCGRPVLDFLLRAKKRTKKNLPFLRDKSARIVHVHMLAIKSKNNFWVKRIKDWRGEVAYDALVGGSRQRCLGSVRMETSTCAATRHLDSHHISW